MAKEMVVQENKAGLPALTIKEAIDRRNAVIEFTKLVMTENVDYGTIPGTNTKPTLLKPGAEKLCSLFKMAPEFELVNSITDFEKGLFYFQYRCKLYQNDNMIASGIGSCNSMEKKYRYRHVPEFKATAQELQNVIAREEKVSRNGNTYVMLTVKNTETYDLVNTYDKMAQKRALVAAVLIGANASELFTQDLEDIIYDAKFVAIEEDDKSDSKPRARQKSGKKYDFKQRPYDPETLKAALIKKTEIIGEYDASEKQRNLLGAMLNEYFQDDKKRYEASEWLFGAASTKDMGGSMVKAALDWIMSQDRDSGGGYMMDETAQTELSGVLSVALEAQGQLSL